MSQWTLGVRRLALRAPSLSSYGHGYLNYSEHLTRPRAGDHDGPHAPLRRRPRGGRTPVRRTLLGAFAADPYIEDALQLTRDLVTESVNDVRTFEGEEVATRINVALRRLINRAWAELAG